MHAIKEGVTKKSNIKDVCALLDMKSSKSKLSLLQPSTNLRLTLVCNLDIEDVNKAFQEMHEEVE